MFINSWNRWHLYEGQAYQRNEFQVVRAYYQTHTKGGPAIFASGTVEGQRRLEGAGHHLAPVGSGEESGHEVGDVERAGHEEDALHQLGAG